MSTTDTDSRTPLSQAEFIQIFRWYRQLRLSSLASMCGVSAGALSNLENDREGLKSASDTSRLAETLGMDLEIWGRVGADPGYPGSAPSAAKATVKSNGDFADQINRIAAMPESWRFRQMKVIRKELAYIDAF